MKNEKQISKEKLIFLNRFKNESLYNIIDYWVIKNLSNFEHNSVKDVYKLKKIIRDLQEELYKKTINDDSLNKLLELK